MSNLLSSLTVTQLRRAADLKEKIEALTKELVSLTGVPDSLPSLPKKTRNKMSAAGRAKIAAAQKARWAKFNAAKEGIKQAVKAHVKNRILSPAARAKIVAAQKARWAKFKAAKKA